MLPDFHPATIGYYTLRKKLGGLALYWVAAICLIICRTDSKSNRIAPSSRAR